MFMKHEYYMSLRKNLAQHLAQCFHFDSGVSGDPEVPNAFYYNTLPLDRLDMFKSVIHSFYDVK